MTAGSVGLLPDMLAPRFVNVERGKRFTFQRVSQHAELHYFAGTTCARICSSVPSIRFRVSVWAETVAFTVL